MPLLYRDHKRAAVVADKVVRLAAATARIRAAAVVASVDLVAAPAVRAAAAVLACR